MPRVGRPSVRMHKRLAQSAPYFSWYDWNHNPNVRKLPRGTGLLKHITDQYRPGKRSVMTSKGWVTDEHLGVQVARGTQLDWASKKPKDGYFVDAQKRIDGGSAFNERLHFSVDERGEVREDNWSPQQLAGQKLRWRTYGPVHVKAHVRGGKVVHSYTRKK